MFFRCAGPLITIADLSHFDKSLKIPTKIYFNKVSNSVLPLVPIREDKVIEARGTELSQNKLYIF